MENELVTFDLTGTPDVVLIGALVNRGYTVTVDRVDIAVRLNEELLELKGKDTFSRLLLDNLAAIKMIDAEQAQEFADRTGGKTRQVFLTKEGSRVLRELRKQWGTVTDGRTIRAFMYVLAADGGK